MIDDHQISLHRVFSSLVFLRRASSPIAEFLLGLALCFHRMKLHRDLGFLHRTLRRVRGLLVHAATLADATPRVLHFSLSRNAKGLLPDELLSLAEPLQTKGQFQQQDLLRRKHFTRDLLLPHAINLVHPKDASELALPLKEVDLTLDASVDQVHCVGAHGAILIVLQ
jgi:hypothetical protein